MAAPPAGGRATGAAKGVLRTLAAVAATLFGLLLVTFLIGRAAPIDPGARRGRRPRRARSLRSVATGAGP